MVKLTWSLLKYNEINYIMAYLYLNSIYWSVFIIAILENSLGLLYEKISKNLK